MFVHKLSGCGFELRYNYMVASEIKISSFRIFYYFVLFYYNTLFVVYVNKINSFFSLKLSVIEVIRLCHLVILSKYEKMISSKNMQFLKLHELKKVLKILHYWLNCRKRYKNKLRASFLDSFMECFIFTLFSSVRSHIHIQILPLLTC